MYKIVKTANNNISRHTRVALATFALAALLMAGQQPASAADNSTLLVMGDSFAYGFTTQQDAIAMGPTNGDMGYVKPFADYLGTQNGGVRPTVLNYAIPGESSTSFMTGLSGVPFPDVYPYTSTLSEAPARFPLLNNNYAPSTAPQYQTIPQMDAALAAIASAHAAGQSVDNIVLQIGGNDFLGILFQPAFQSLTTAQQEGLLLAQFGKLQDDYNNILGSIKAVAPEARIFTLGYPNSFRQTPGIGDKTDFLVTNVNSLVEDISGDYGANYVDIYTPFTGHELEWTHEGDGGMNPHPNADGYAVIANQLRISAVATAAPEPGSFSLLALALPTAVGMVLIRRRRSQNRNQVMLASDCCKSMRTCLR